MAYETTKEMLAENPRLMGLVFTFLLLIAEMGHVTAAGSSYAGP